MKKRVLVPSLVVSALLVGSLVMAGPGGYGCGKSGGSGDCIGNKQGAMTTEQHEQRMGNKLEMMSTVLDLTEEQESQLEALFNQQHQEKQALREQMHASREEMRTAQNAVPFNEADFRAKAATQAELKTEMMVEHAKLKQQVFAILTPEQQEKAEKLGGLMGGRNKGSRHGGSGF